MISEPQDTWVRRLCRVACRFSLGVASFGLTAWSTAAIYYSNLPAHWLRVVVAAAFALGTVVLFLRAPSRWIARMVLAVAFGAVVVWFLLTPPSNQRDWQSDVALLPVAEITGGTVAIRNIRNCDYRTETDYTVRHYDKQFELAKLRSMDFYVVYWGSPRIAHTMVSFDFEGGDCVCFSIETRKEKGESYSAIKGFFRQFELTYVIGDERDLIRLRTNYRNEQVFLYRLATDPATARLIFLDYLREVNRLYEKPQWYNALTSNCTTDVHGHTYPYAKKVRWDWRILINGYVDELAYDVGALDRSLPFAELKKRSLINDRAKLADTDPEFSKRIREGLPGMTP